MEKAWREWAGYWLLKLKRKEAGHGRIEKHENLA